MNNPNLWWSLLVLSVGESSSERERARESERARERERDSKTFIHVNKTNITLHHVIQSPHVPTSTLCCRTGARSIGVQARQDALQRSLNLLLSVSITTRHDLVTDIHTHLVPINLQSHHARLRRRIHVILPTSSCLRRVASGFRRQGCAAEAVREHRAHCRKFSKVSALVSFKVNSRTEVTI